MSEPAQELPEADIEQERAVKLADQIGEQSKPLTAAELIKLGEAAVADTDAKDG